MNVHHWEFDFSKPVGTYTITHLNICKDKVKNGIITCLYFSYAKDCGMLSFSVNKSSPSVTFRALLLLEKGSKNLELSFKIQSWSTNFLKCY